MNTEKDPEFTEGSGMGECVSLSSVWCERDQAATVQPSLTLTFHYCNKALSFTEVVPMKQEVTRSACMCHSAEVCSDVADVKPQEEEEREDQSFSENGMQGAEGVTDPRK